MQDSFVHFMVFVHPRAFTSLRLEEGNFCIICTVKPVKSFTTNNSMKQTEVDVIEDVDEYQTIPGVIILVLRVVVMFCFLLALRETMMHEFTQVSC